MLLTQTNLATHEFDYIVPVPLHWARYAARGFNQAHEMAKVIGSVRNKPVRRVVRRVHKTAFQSSLSSKERQENVKSAFDIHYWYKLTGTDFLKNKHVLIVDDLCTTGATLVHVAKVLAKFKPASLTAFVGCRAV